MDFRLTDKLDLDFSETEGYLEQDNGETSVISAFFTDARANEQRGYWLDDVNASEVWRYEQARLNNETAAELTETAKEVSKKIVSDGLFSRVDASAFVADSMYMALHLKCYNKNDVVVERKFVI